MYSLFYGKFNDLHNQKNIFLLSCFPGYKVDYHHWALIAIQVNYWLKIIFPKYDMKCNMEVSAIR